jgi:hypothetical protein
MGDEDRDALGLAWQAHFSYAKRQFRDYNVTTTPGERPRGMNNAAFGERRPTVKGTRTHC